MSGVWPLHTLWNNQTNRHEKSYENLTSSHLAIAPTCRRPELGRLQHHHSQFTVYLTTLSATQATQHWIVDNQLPSWKWRDRNRPRTNLSYHPNNWLKRRRSCSDTAGSGSDWAYRRITKLRKIIRLLGCYAVSMGYSSLRFERV